MNPPLPWDETLIIVPTYNEIANIERLLREIFRRHPAASVLVVEDNSPDGTAGAVKTLQGEFPGLHMIERKGKLGLASAYISGFKWALGHQEKTFCYIFEMDSDFSHHPSHLAELLAAAQKADLAIGSRYVGGIRVVNWPFKRLLLSYLAGMYIRCITGLPLADPTGGFKCFTRRALEALDLNGIVSRGYIFQLELNYKVFARGLKMVEVPIVFHERVEGDSKMSGSIIFEALFNVLRLRWRHLRGVL